MSSYFLNGPVTLLVVLLGSLFNILTIYVLSAHTLYSRQKKASSVSQNCIMQQSRKCVSSSSIKEYAVNKAVKRTYSSPTHSPDEEGGMCMPLMESESPRPKRSNGPAKKISFSLKESMGTSTEESKPKLAVSPLARQASLISHTSNSGVSAPRPRVYTFFLWLVVWDTALLISALLMYSVPTLLDRNLKFYVHFSSVYYLMSNTALTASVWLMCALIFDRYRTICRPFVMRQKGSRMQQSRDRGKIHKVLCLVCVLALAFSLPRFFELSLEYDPTVEEYFLVQTSIVRNKIYMVGYRIVGGLLLYSLLPYVVLFILSFKVWLVMREAALARLKISATSTHPSSPIPHGPPSPSRLSFYSRHKQTINSIIHRHPQNSSRTAASDSERILVCVMAKFLLSRLMPTVLDVMEHLVGNDQFVQSPTVTTFVDTSNLVVVMASAANFCIFYTFSRSFRHLATYLVCCGSGGKDLRRTASQKICSNWAVSSKKLKWTKLNGGGQLTDNQETCCSVEKTVEHSIGQEIGLDSGCLTSTSPTSSCLMPTQEQAWRYSAEHMDSLEGTPICASATISHPQLTSSSSFPLNSPCNEPSKKFTFTQCSHSQHSFIAGRQSAGDDQVTILQPPDISGGVEGKNQSRQ